MIEYHKLIADALSNINVKLDKLEENRSKNAVDAIRDTTKAQMKAKMEVIVSSLKDLETLQYEKKEHSQNQVFFLKHFLRNEIKSLEELAHLYIQFTDTSGYSLIPAAILHIKMAGHAADFSTSRIVAQLHERVIRLLKEIREHRRTLNDSAKKSRDTFTKSKKAWMNQRYPNRTQFPGTNSVNALREFYKINEKEGHFYLELENKRAETHFLSSNAPNDSCFSPKTATQRTQQLNSLSSSTKSNQAKSNYADKLESVLTDTVSLTEKLLDRA